MFKLFLTELGEQDETHAVRSSDEYNASLQGTQSELPAPAATVPWGHCVHSLSQDPLNLPEGQRMQAFDVVGEAIEPGKQHVGALVGLGVGEVGLGVGQIVGVLVEGDGEGLAVGIRVGAVGFALG